MKELAIKYSKKWETTEQNGNHITSIRSIKFWYYFLLQLCQKHEIHPAFPMTTTTEGGTLLNWLKPFHAKVLTFPEPYFRASMQDFLNHQFWRLTFPGKTIYSRKYSQGKWFVFYCLVENLYKIFTLIVALKISMLKHTKSR